ncbi:tRNA (adenosine(37)-N6)-threonylcarbamoyltransferase complex transferase subunit TsaD [Patescibacteria group bacterium]|nr:tRNA (adenosine(37)-N6)-threonylcarbamoyltransferase complex transferase subunit TsaD [Patescibacteria group bacterium]
MKILAIETSCDETAAVVLEGSGDVKNASFAILGNALLSQADLHAPFGGVYPNLAKREHQTNLVPLTAKALTDAGLYVIEEGITPSQEEALSDVRDTPFKDSIKDFIYAVKAPDIDMIAVTHGPGLEPALWTGINFAVALGKAWNIPVMGIDHMEGHIVSALLEPEGKNFTLRVPQLPALSLLISGGHTEFVTMDEWFVYERIGETKDDAVGEAFDKVARLLNLAYPGGPQVAALAARSRERGKNEIIFPRPMATDNTCDFSFSGLKTAVMYKLQKMDKISEEDKEHIAHAFEDAVRDVLIIKTRRALSNRAFGSFVIGGGVSANDHIRRGLVDLVQKEFTDMQVYMPDKALTGDNAIMIGAAAYLRASSGKKPQGPIFASGSLRLS